MIAAERAGAEQRRRHARTGIALAGRYMTSDGAELPCVTVDVSPCGLRLKTPGQPPRGARIIAYIRELGRLEGMVVRNLEDGFALALRATPGKTERLRNHIERLHRRDDPALAERRPLPRLELEGACVLIYDARGRERRVELIDVSATGLAFRADFLVKAGDAIEIGAQKARITRLFEGGAAASFL